MAGNQGHKYDWISSFPFFYMSEFDVFSKSQDGFQKQEIQLLGMMFGLVVKL